MSGSLEDVYRKPRPKGSIETTQYCVPIIDWQGPWILERFGDDDDPRRGSGWHVLGPMYHLLDASARAHRRDPESNLSSVHGVSSTVVGAAILLDVSMLELTLYKKWILMDILTRNRRHRATIIATKAREQKTLADGEMITVRKANQAKCIMKQAMQKIAKAAELKNPRVQRTSKRLKLW